MEEDGTEGLDGDKIMVRFGAAEEFGTDRGVEGADICDDVNTLRSETGKGVKGREE